MARNDTIFDRLVGQKIEGFLMQNEVEFGFLLADGRVMMYECEGDCCSETWLHHVGGLDNLIGRVVTEAVDKGEVGVDGTRDESEYGMFWTLKTDRGYFDFEVRNASNGYYGGWVNKVRVRHKNDEDKYNLITEDF